MYGSILFLLFRTCWLRCVCYKPCSVVRHYSVTWYNNMTAFSVQSNVRNYNLKHRKLLISLMFHHSNILGATSDALFGLVGTSHKGTSAIQASCFGTQPYYEPTEFDGVLIPVLFRCVQWTWWSGTC